MRMALLDWLSVRLATVWCTHTATRHPTIINTSTKWTLSTIRATTIQPPPPSTRKKVSSIWSTAEAVPMEVAQARLAAVALAVMQETRAAVVEVRQLAAGRLANAAAALLNWPFHLGIAALRSFARISCRRSVTLGMTNFSNPSFELIMTSGFSNNGFSICSFFFTGCSCLFFFCRPLKPFSFVWLSVGILLSWRWPS